MAAASGRRIRRIQVGPLAPTRIGDRRAFRTVALCRRYDRLPSGAGEPRRKEQGLDLRAAAHGRSRRLHGSTGTHHGRERHRKGTGGAPDPHARYTAKKRDLVVLDCTTIVPELSGSEFFGHERGAFTGAVSARDGAFARADMGTLFLDEVGDLPLGLQAELLRVVQEHSYKRVGGNQWQQTRFRLVCATNRDLQQDQAEGRFRRDFYYRIAGCTCKLPPLRERTEDILPLAEFFLRQLRPDHEAAMDEAVREYLLQQTYAGNVRDLKQIVTRISHRHVGPGPVSAGDIAEEDRPAVPPSAGQWNGAELEAAVRGALAGGATLKEIGQAASAAAIRIVTAEEDGNLRRAAQRLGITDRALQMRRAAQRENGMADGEAIA